MKKGKELYGTGANAMIKEVAGMKKTSKGSATKKVMSMAKGKGMKGMNPYC